jgi:hypothetical protein
MQAGFAKVDITPPLGTPLLGYGETATRLAERINDPLHLRALWVSYGGKTALILGVDFCFIGRDDSDRIKGVLGRELGLLPAQVMISATHNHAGPAMGCYYDLEYEPPLRDYLRDLDGWMLQAALQARDAQREVRVRAGMSRSKLPMNRRLRREGKIVNAPNPAGEVLDSLPLCLLEGLDGKPVALLFAVSTHVVCMNKKVISADFPGVAMDKLDAHLGATCSLFLQGCGGDSRPALLGEGRRDWNWQCGWPEAQAIGTTLALEVIAALGSLKPVQPAVHSALVDTHWPLQGNLRREDYQAELGDFNPANGKPSGRQRWAQRFIRLAEQGKLRKTAPILMQGIQLGEGLRLVAIEGEPLGGHGRAMEQAYGEGVTFALGYANGEGMYLPTSAMIDVGGYEVESFWEYGQPSCLAKGLETARDEGLAEIRRRGVK